MGDSVRDATELLRRADIRPTRQRLALAELLLAGGDRHVTAEQLHSEAEASGIRLSLATVYNTLNQFHAVGLLSEVVVDGERTYFDTNLSAHHHFFDETSQALTDIPGEAISVSEIPSPPDGYETVRVEVMIRVRKKPD